jgi:hypothetical protein
MTATPISHSAPTARGDELHALAVQLYGLLSSGHDALAWNVDPRGPALTVIGADGKRRPVQIGRGDAGGSAPPWQRARELREGGVEVDRRFNPWVLERHLRGKYSVAPAAPGWVQWVALDIDAHPAPGDSELVARRLAKARADRVLAGVWRALHCSAERHPLVLRSPGGGYHVWFPLTRGPSSSNPEHTWPALVARAWFERHLLAAGLELAPGVLEVFPSGRYLRAPCGLGQQVLQATRPDDPDALDLVPWSGTMASAERVDWRGERPALSAPVRRVVPMVRSFVAQWDAQRRTLADWLGRPEASWDPAWGFLGWRLAPTSASEKNSGMANAVNDGRSQESDDVPGRPQAGGVPIAGAGAGTPGRGRHGKRSDSSSILDETRSLPAQEADAPPALAGVAGVRGRAFKEKVRKLLLVGITEPSTRHDAVLTLAFYWAATCGLGQERALERLEAWCRAHPHTGSRLAARERVFRETCLREARHYITHHAARWRFRGRGDGGGLATLTMADRTVIAAIDARVQGEVSTILAWLAGRADGEGRIGEPVQISTGLLARLCGDRRIEDDGKRRRTTTLALAELERLGVLTLAHNYRVGQRGRVWSCWYQFGSGEVSHALEMPAKDWAALVPPPSALVTAPALAAAPPTAPRPESPDVVVRVVGERAIPEGMLRVLSAGERGLPRTLLTLASDVASPTAVPSARAPWFVRPFQARTFTPAELRSVNAATVVAFPDLEARRRMTRGERLAWGGALSSVVPVRAVAPGEVAAGPGEVAAGPGEVREPPAAVESPPAIGELRAELAAAESPPAIGELRAELAVEVGSAAATLPLDLVDVVAHAWRAFRRGRDP